MTESNVNNDIAKQGNESEYPNYGPGHYMHVRPEFRELLADAPADLTGFDLSPFYDLAENRGEDFAIRQLERAWQPNAADLGDAYNGPIGDGGTPLRENVRKWEEAKADEPRRKQEKLSADILVMCDKEAQNPLIKATHEMMKVAFGVQLEDGTCPDLSPFEDLQNYDMLSVLASLRILDAALSELKRMAAAGIYNRETWALEELELCKTLSAQGEVL